jgi:3-deoxy-D-manno-octulosonic-acid transferase
MKIWRRDSLYLRERLGLRLPPGRTASTSLWVHAVSVGEVLSLRSLFSRIRSAHPDWIIYFSTLTNTGYRIAREKLPEADRVFFIPLDFAPIVRRFFSVIQPDLFILAESEFWPNLLRAARRQSPAVLLINGRMSVRSFRKYQRLRSLTRRVLGNIDRFLVQTKIDQDRLERVGIAPGRIAVAGNLKAEVQLPSFGRAQLAELKSGYRIPMSSKVIVAGSTHKGEDRILLEGYARAKKSRPEVVMVLAPRHPQRAVEVEKMGQHLGLRMIRRTAADSGTPWDVLILDTIGELANFYALSDLAFVGGSLIPHGGQNLLEPAYYEKPVFFGPHMDNFASLAAEFVRLGAALVVHDENELAEVFLMKDEQALREMGKKAGAVLGSLQGATDKTLQVIEEMILPGNVRK